MKLSQILNEFVVKVPETTFNAALTFVIGVYFGQLLAIHRKYNKQLSLEFKRAIKRATDKYGKFEIYDVEPDAAMQATVPYRTNELPKNYKKHTRREYKIVLYVGNVGMDDSAGLYSQKRKGRAGRVYINIRKNANLMAALNQPEVIDAQLIALAGTLEHELMHATQDIALRGVDRTLFSHDYINQDGTIDLEKHSASDIEFSPMVKTAASVFQKDIEMIRTKHDISKQDVIAYLRAFINPTEKSPFTDGRAAANPFFANLYNSDKQKWKKAVKYLHGLLRTYIDSF